MGKKQYTTKNREEVFKEKADKGYGICHSQTCEQRGHCLHALLCSYVPQDRYYTTCVNLNNPLMQTAHCPAYLSDQPVRMPLGISNIYYDMPARIASPLKQHLIAYFNPPSTNNISVRQPSATAGSIPLSLMVMSKITCGNT